MSYTERSALEMTRLVVFMSSHLGMINLLHNKNQRASSRTWPRIHCCPKANVPSFTVWERSSTQAPDIVVPGHVRHCGLISWDENWQPTLVGCNPRNDWDAHNQHHKNDRDRTTATGCLNVGIPMLKYAICSHQGNAGCQELLHVALMTLVAAYFAACSGCSPGSLAHLCPKTMATSTITLVAYT